MGINEIKFGEVYERTNDFIIFLDVKGSTYYFLLFDFRDGFCSKSNIEKTSMMIENFCEQTFIPKFRRLGIKRFFESFKI